MSKAGRGTRLQPPRTVPRRSVVSETRAEAGTALRQQIRAQCSERTRTRASKPWRILRQYLQRPTPLPVSIGASARSARRSETILLAGKLATLDNRPRCTHEAVDD